MSSRTTFVTLCFQRPSLLDSFSIDICLRSDQSVSYRIPDSIYLYNIARILLLFIFTVLRLLFNIDVWHIALTRSIADAILEQEIRIKNFRFIYILVVKHWIPLHPSV
jgi:hypothetical protein